MVDVVQPTTAIRAGEASAPASATRSPPQETTQQQQPTTAIRAGEATAPASATRSPPQEDGPGERTIQAHLPEYVIAQPLGEDYNNIDKATFIQNIHEIFEATLTWKKNLFLVPTGKSGKEFIKLKTQWLQKFNNGSPFQHHAMKVFHILPNILLQKPSATSKARDHSNALETRLQMWSEGRIMELFKDNRVIQQKLSNRPKRSSHDINRIFTKLMFEGKVGSALKFIDENAENSVLQPTPEVIEKLKELHPEQSPIHSETLMDQ